MSLFTKDIRFQPVLYAMVEPSLKLIVTPLAMRESHYNNLIEIEHDPEMQADCLTGEMSEMERQSWSRVNTSPPPLILRRTPACREATNIMVTPYFGGTALNLFVADMGDGFKRTASLLRKCVGEAISGLEYEVIYQTLASAVHLPALRSDAKSQGRLSIASVALFLENSLYRELHHNTGRAFDPAAGPLVLFAEAALK